MFARRAGWDLTPNELARLLEARRARGLPVVDLTDANPTRCGLREPARAAERALAHLAHDPTARRYEPEPRGPMAARAAVAAYHRRGGAAPAPEHVVLTAGTSEGYAHLFRLLGDPGDVVHVPEPGYPLFEHIASLEGLAVRRYRLLPPAPSDPVVGGSWRLDLSGLARDLRDTSRAVLVIHPHNPTGSYVSPGDLAALRVLCRERGLALVSDEVFADYPTGGAAPPGALAGADHGPLTFALSGASKVLGLPQWKVGWIVTAGPAAARDEALARLEFVADAFLSVSPILAGALPALLQERSAVQVEIRARVADNRARLAAALAAAGARAPLPAEGGWAALVPLADGVDEEALVLGLLERAGVLVQPGFLFDLEGYLVLSLLPEPGRFARGLAPLVEALA